MDRLLRIIKNKYFLVLLFASIWITFFDNYNLLAQYNMRQKVNQLEQDKTHYQQKIKELDFERERLFSDPAEMERFAREEYLMSRSKEDVFIITDQ